MGASMFSRKDLAKRWRAFRKRIRRRLCKHTGMVVQAGTGAELDGDPVEAEREHHGVNVKIGTVMRCRDCGAAWTGDLVACAPPEVHPRHNRRPFSPANLRVVGTP